MRMFFRARSWSHPPTPPRTSAPTQQIPALKRHDPAANLKHMLRYAPARTVARTRRVESQTKLCRERRRQYPLHNTDSVVIVAVVVHEQRGINCHGKQRWQGVSGDESSSRDEHPSGHRRPCASLPQIALTKGILYYGQRSKRLSATPVYEGFGSLTRYPTTRFGLLCNIRFSAAFIAPRQVSVYIRVEDNPDNIFYSILMHTSPHEENYSNRG